MQILGRETTERLAPSLPTDRLRSWVMTLTISGFALLLRWRNLGQPGTLMFDEPAYAKDAWSLLQQGYEGVWTGDPTTIDLLFTQGDYSALTSTVEWVSHPEVGKWLIAVGEAVFGPTPFGWRFMPVVFGALLIMVTIRLARRLSHSTLIGGLAGVLLAMDGLAFVMSRIAMVDIFQIVFIVAAVSCAVADRDYFQQRLADHIMTRPDHTLGDGGEPFIFRPWLLAAGTLFGLGCATKWNTIYPLVVFSVLVIVWSLKALRLAGSRHRIWRGLLVNGVTVFVFTVVVAAGIYVASWIPWLCTAPGHEFQWPVNPESWVSRHFGKAVGSLWQWHIATYEFHTGPPMTDIVHPYASSPWVWPIDGATTGMYAQTVQPGDQGCTSATGCLQVVTALGTPILWWLASAAVVIGLVFWIIRRDWRFGVMLLAMCSTWIPWMFSGRGALFSYYSLTMIPFMVICLALALSTMLKCAKAKQRRLVAIIIAVLGISVVADFAFMYPLYTGELITQQQWHWRIWFSTWI